MSDAFALLSAVCVAAGSMLVAEIGGRLSAPQIARSIMGTAFVMACLPATALDGWRTPNAEGSALLAGSRAFGIKRATLAFYGAIRKAGPVWTALLFSLTSPFALLLGWSVFGGTVGGRQASGVVCVVAGICLPVCGPRPRFGGGFPWRGLGLGIITAAGRALGNLFARPAMSGGVEPFAAMSVRSGLGFLFFRLLCAPPFARRGGFSRIRFGDAASLAGSAVIGTGFGTALLMAALARGEIGTVSTPSSTTPVTILPMARSRTGRRPHAASRAGAVLAVVGIGLISL